MSTSSQKAKRLLELFGRIKSFDELLGELTYDEHIAAENKVPDPLSWSAESQKKRLAFLKQQTGTDLPFFRER